MKNLPTWVTRKVNTLDATNNTSLEQQMTITHKFEMFPGTKERDSKLQLWHHEDVNIYIHENTNNSYS